MNIGELVFSIGDVVTIIGCVGSCMGTYYVLKASTAKADSKAELAIESLKESKVESEIRLTQLKEDKRAAILKLEQDITEIKTDLKEKESMIYKRIEAARDEQKEAHNKLSIKLDTVVTTLGTMSVNIAEMNGYLKAKKED